MCYKIESWCEILSFSRDGANSSVKQSPINMKTKSIDWLFGYLSNKAKIMRFWHDSMELWPAFLSDEV